MDVCSLLRRGLAMAKQVSLYFTEPMAVRVSHGDVIACFCLAGACLVAAFVELVIYIPEW
jgi:hypothetical protein